MADHMEIVNRIAANHNRDSAPAATSVMPPTATAPLRAFKEASALVSEFAKYLDNPTDPALYDSFKVTSSVDFWSRVSSHFGSMTAYLNFYNACVAYIDTLPVPFESQAAAHHANEHHVQLAQILSETITKPHWRVCRRVYRRIQKYLGPQVYVAFMEDHREYVDNPDSMWPEKMCTPEAFADSAAIWLKDNQSLLAELRSLLGLETITAVDSQKEDKLDPAFFENLLAQDLNFGQDFSFQPDVFNNDGANFAPADNGAGTFSNYDWDGFFDPSNLN